MKKILLLVATLFCFSGLVFADICSDVRQSYQDRMLALKRDTDAALSQTTDPMEISAIRASYDMQLQQLTMEMGIALTSEGCNVVTPPPPIDPPPTDPGTPPTDPGTPPTDPGTPPTDPGTPPTDPGTPPTDTCREQMTAYMDQLKSMGLHRNEFLARLKSHAHEIGCDVGNGNHCDRNNHHECKPKPPCNPTPPQCDRPDPHRNDCHRQPPQRCDDRDHDHNRHHENRCDR